MGYLIAIMIIVWACLMGFLFSSISNETAGLRVQCANTASTIQASTWNFDESHNVCTIVTQDNKLVRF